MLKDFDVLDNSTGEAVGKLQAQYRGNYPSAYFHNEQTAFNINGNTTTGKLGAMLSGVAAGMAYSMGLPAPAFSDVRSKPEGTSPDFSGWVEAKWAAQIKLLVGHDGGKARLREDLIVGEDMVFGTASNGTQVRGWQLVEFGYSSDGLGCLGMSCMGKYRKPRNIRSLQEVKDMVNVALESQIGEVGTTFLMRFRLPDQEKQVIKKGENVAGALEIVDSKFNPPRGGFIDHMEQVDCTINCIRLWKFPCQFTQDKMICCRCPLYARLVENANVHPSKWAEPPPAVVMIGAQKKAFDPQQASAAGVYNPA